MVAAPPRINIAVTMRHVSRQKKRKTKWAGVPQRTCTTSSTVWIAGHLRLISIAKMANNNTWMVAPEAYQKGPDTPKAKATFEDWRSVAAHVHFDTTSAAVRPAEIERPAVLYTSELLPVWSSAATFLLACHTSSVT